MFAVIYQCYIKPDYEQEFQQLWNKIASYFIQERGAIGCCLHRTTDGRWLAYSRWPDQATREATWKDGVPSTELSKEILHDLSRVKICVDQERKLPDICMEVVNDLFAIPQ